ncbi:MAG: hypothetical protein AB7F12_10095 [Pseudonocardia sp.]
MPGTVASAAWRWEDACSVQRNARGSGATTVLRLHRSAVARNSADAARTSADAGPLPVVGRCGRP